MEVVYLFLWALLAGVVGSLVGIGGGLILTPVMTIIFDIEIKYAIAASIVAVIATSSGASINFLKDKISNVKIALFLEIFTSAGAVIGALLTGVLPESVLYILFSFILMNSLYSMLKKANFIKTIKKERVSREDSLAEYLEFNSSYYDKAENREIIYTAKNIKKASGVMLGAGLASGLLGIGSGVFKVMALDQYMNLPIKVSTATSNFMMGVTATASALIYFFNGDINPYIAAPVALGTLIGANVGAKIMQKINSHYIRLLMLVILVITIVNMLLKGLGVL